MKSLSLTALLACLPLAAAIATPAGDPPAAYVDRALSEALLDLRSRGLNIVFSDNVVRPEMVVAVEPTGQTAREWLDALLVPHSLAVREGPNDTLIVVPSGPSPGGPEEPSLRGLVLSKEDGSPLAGASVRFLKSSARASTDSEGRFRLPWPEEAPWTFEARLEGFLPERFKGVDRRSPELLVLLERLPVVEDELVVTPSRLSLLREDPAGPLELSRDDILKLPHLGDDFFRAISLLPGATANDVSAQFHVRGGRRDETQILIDGQELYDAYHLKDFDSALSFVAPSTLGSADLTTGGFTARYGDRMSGVLEMNTLTPSGPTKIRLGLGFATAQIGAAGELPNERGSWIGEVRRGTTDFVARLLTAEDPQYWDGFAKLDLKLNPRHGLRVNLLYSGDKLDFQKLLDGETKLLETEYNSSYLWLTHHGIFSSNLLVETAVSLSRIDRDRRGVELEEDARFSIIDARDTEISGLRQNWSLSPIQAHSFRLGWQLRRFRTSYDYTGVHDFDNPLARIRHDFGQDSTDFIGRLKDDHSSAHLSDRIRLTEPLTLELGLRYDRHSLTHESQVSPRLNLAYASGEDGVFRLAWGRFNQSQRPYELLVEDGDPTLYPVEQSEHRILGYERLLKIRPDSPAVAFRVEIYRREVRNPRPRYENLFEPINTFPEVEPDRVRIAPERSVAQGIELFLRSTGGSKLGWWIAYTYASTEDEIAGTTVKRLFDQTHGLNLDLDYRFGPHWRINLGWRYHTGWPTTPLSLQPEEDDEGEIRFIPVLGPLNSQRLPRYHRLDVRASRIWRLRRGDLVLFFDVQNAYDRENIGGFDFEIDEEEGTIVDNPEPWPGFFPTFGVSFEF